MDRIYSKDNALVKETKKLNEKKYRIQKNKFLIEGFRFIGEALNSNFNVPIIFFSEKVIDKWNDFKAGIRIDENIKTYLVTDQILRHISNTDNPQGIVAVIDNRNIDVINKRGFYILVDKVQDPGNMGTIIRTAHAAGALGVILTKGTVDVYNEKTLRATMGSIFHIPIIQDENLEKLSLLRQNGFKLIASSLNADKNFYDVKLKDKIVVVLGNEGNGVSSEILDLADIKVKIPMPGNAESLNVSIAGAIMMFEIVRQTRI